MVRVIQYFEFSRMSIEGFCGQRYFQSEAVDEAHRYRFVARIGRLKYLLAAAIVAWHAAAPTTAVAAGKEFDLDIPSTTADVSIKNLSRQTGYSVIFQSVDVENIETNPVTGRYTLQGALDALFRGTVLSGRLTKLEVITISYQVAGTDGERDVDSTGKKGGVLAGIGAFLASIVAAPNAVGQENVGDRGRQTLEEIVVTASKREQNLRDVAASVSALSGQQLSQMGAQSLADYVASMPGVVFNDYQPGVSEVVIRGVSSSTYHEQGQTVVGYYVNEVPLSEAGWPIVIPDIDTFDLKRVEVLRGPQGTLFGSASLGGLVNYIAEEADPGAFDSAVELTWGETDNAGESNYAVKGMLNAPIVDGKFAVRGVLLERYDAGFIDNVNTGVDGANDLKTRGARLSAVYTPSETTRLSWMTLYQKSELDDQTYVTVPTLTRDTFVPEPHEPELTIHSLRLDQDLGVGTLTLLGAFADKSSRIVFDQTVSGFLQGIPTETIGRAEADIENFEVRLASSTDGRLSWLVGGMYHSSDKRSADNIVQEGATAFIDANPADFGGYAGSLLAPDNVISSYQVNQENEEFAVFGEIGYDLTDQLALTVGGRFFDTSTESTVTRPPSATFIGVYDAVGSQFTEGADETGFTPKVSLAWQPSDRFMTYGSYSEGFRVGGANPNPPDATGAGATTAYDSDSVRNYEVGVRTTWADSALQLDATVFHIDWQDIQVRLFTPAPLFLAYVTNAGSADIDGVEFSGVWRVSSIFDLASNVTYLDARLSEFLPDTFAPGGGHPKGSTLPGASDWTVNTTATLSLAGRWEPQFIASHQYISKAPVAFSSVTERGGFSLVDLRARIRLRENADLSIFANNAFDKYGILNAPFADFFPQPLGSVTRPRTVGMTFNWYMN
jgi:outer membrane receptor protein involved in Fe transport